MIGRHRRLSLSRSFPSFLLFFWKVVVFLRIRKECRTHFPIRIPLTVIFHFLLNLNFPSTFDVASCTTVGLTACTFFILISVSLSWRWRQLPCCLSSVKTTTLHVCHLFDWLLYLFFPACVEAAALLRHFTHVFISVCLIYFHANPSQVIPHRLCTLYCPPLLYIDISLSLSGPLSLSLRLPPSVLQTRQTSRPEELNLLVESECRCHGVCHAGLRHVQGAAQATVILRPPGPTLSAPCYIQS